MTDKTSIKISEAVEHATLVIRGLWATPLDRLPLLRQAIRDAMATAAAPLHEEIAHLLAAISTPERCAGVVSEVVERERDEARAEVKRLKRAMDDHLDILGEYCECGDGPERCACCAVAERLYNIADTPTTERHDKHSRLWAAKAEARNNTLRWVADMLGEYCECGSIREADDDGNLAARCMFCAAADTLRGMAAPPPTTDKTGPGGNPADKEGE